MQTTSSAAATSKEFGIEPGLLALFRLATAVRLALSLLSALRLVARGGSFAFVLLNLSDGLLLLGYLSWPWLQRRLSRAYLPIALALATAGPLTAQYIWVTSFESTGLAFLLSAWQLLPTLLIPVLMAAWQYGFRASLTVIAGALALDALWIPLALAAIGAPAASLPVPSSLETIAPTMLWWGLLGVLLGRSITSLAVGYMTARLVAAQRTQRAALAEANARLVGYAATLEQLATSRERNRLARELHDTLAHSLSATAVQLEGADALWETAPAEAHALLTQSLEATRRGLAETRRALQSLRAGPLEDLGLGLALRELSASVATRNRLTLDLQAPARVEGLTPAVEQCIYRVAQEALENVARHALARHVAVSLEVQGRRVVLSIADDGQGFDAPAALAGGRFGLRGMQERAEIVGGVLEISSAPGRGATVRLSVAADAPKVSEA